MLLEDRYISKYDLIFILTVLEERYEENFSTLKKRIMNDPDEFKVMV
jgi:hypothetical protein